MTTETPRLELSGIAPEEEDRSISLGDSLAMLMLAGPIGLVANRVATGNTPLAALPGMLILLAAPAVGLRLVRIAPVKLPAIPWVSALAILLTAPGLPWSARSRRRAASSASWPWPRPSSPMAAWR